VPKDRKFDRASFGHIAFGVCVAFIVTVLGVEVNYQIIRFFWAYSSILWSVFIIWEGIEHTLFFNYIYPKGWHESLGNSIVDIILGVGAYEIIFRLNIISPNLVFYVAFFTVLACLIAIFSYHVEGGKETGGTIKYRKKMR
jgi:hypothetical protein